MKAEELRVGNVVEYLIRDEMDARKEWWEPSQIDAQDILWLSQNPDDEEYRPIPLTEEWLLRLGGKKVWIYHEWVIAFGRLNLYCMTNKKWCCSIERLLVYDKIQFVHQLQNLYFALTGQELETALKT